MRRWLLDLHLYLGLLCLPYVVVFGVSSILLNHDIRREASARWSAQLAPLAEAPPAQQASAAQRALGLTGNVLPHTVKASESGSLEFKLIRPGRSYQVAVAADGEASVLETSGGVLGIVRDLHGLSDIKSSRWSFGWAVFTELASAVLLFSIVSGALLVLPRPSERALSLSAGALGLAAVVALAAAIW
jgi:hypothetical protein